MNGATGLGSALLLLALATGCVGTMTVEDPQAASDAKLVQWVAVAAPAKPNTADAVALVQLSDAARVRASALPSIASNLDSVAWSADRHDWVALDAAGNVQHRIWERDAWSDWQDLGRAAGVAAHPAAPIAIASWEPERLDVFTTLPSAPGSTSQVLAHRFYDRQWGRWETLGGTLAQRGLTATSGRPHGLDVFALFEDGLVYRKSYAANWSEWESMGAPPFGVSADAAPHGNLLASAPDAQGRPVVFTYDVDGTIFSRTAGSDGAWTVVDASRRTVPGRLRAVRRSGGIELFAYDAARGDVLQARLAE
jgi:hypothetical protein